MSLDDTRPAGVRVLHVAATSMVEEHAAAALLSAFTDRTPGVEATVAVASPTRFAELLDRRRADITLGPRPSLAEAARLVAVPFLRYRMIVVAGPRPPPAPARADLAPAELAAERWMVGPGGVEDGGPAARWFAHSRIAPPDVRAFGSDAAALDAVASGEGVMLALWHAAMPAVHRARAAPPGRARHPGRRPLVREHAGRPALPHGRGGAAPLRHEPRGHAGDGLAARRGPRRARARRRPRDAVELGRAGGDRRWPRRSGAAPRVLGAALERGDRLEQEPRSAATSSASVSARGRPRR